LVEVYEEIRRSLNYEVIHKTVDEILRGSSYARRELVGLMAAAADLASPLNWHLARLYAEVISDITNHPDRSIKISELTPEIIERIYTPKELRQIAKQLNVKGRTKMSAAELAVAISKEEW
jgi:Rho termination factor, N-terminal domain